MVCARCKGKRCTACDGTGKQHVMLIGLLDAESKHHRMLGGLLNEVAKDTPDNGEPCGVCKGERRVNVDHESCQKDNAKRGFANCDCQHRSSNPQSAFLHSA